MTLICQVFCGCHGHFLCRNRWISTIILHYHFSKMQKVINFNGERCCSLNSSYLDRGKSSKQYGMCKFSTLQCGLILGADSLTTRNNMDKQQNGWHAIPGHIKLNSIPNPPQSNKIQQWEVKKSYYVIEAGIIWARKSLPGQRHPSSVPGVDSALWCERTPVCIPGGIPILDPSLSEEII